MNVRRFTNKAYKNKREEFKIWLSNGKPVGESVAKIGDLYGHIDTIQSTKQLYNLTRGQEFEVKDGVVYINETESISKTIRRWR